jgi:hypothetical protein
MAQRESPQRFPYSITNAMFIPTGGDRYDVVVVGRGFIQRAVPLAARVGAQPVESITVRSDGTSFSGRLSRAPSPGDRLTVGYMDEELQPTAIVFRGGPQPPMV